MSIAQTAIRKRVVTAFSTLLLCVGGLAMFFTLGQLEDPEFTIKNATVTTTYPGASAAEVELEVSDRIEMAIQKMPQLKKVESVSKPGLSIVKIEIRSSYSSEQLPQIWDELRRKVTDVASSLPPGTSEPLVGDDFGDVYGFLLAVTADGFDYAELETYVDAIKKELSVIDGVARVEIWGLPRRCIYLDVAQARLSQLGLTVDDIQRALSQQNLVVDSGGFDLGDDRFRIEQTGAFRSPEDIANLVVRGTDLSQQQVTDELLRIGDIATVRRGYVEPPANRMRYKNRQIGSANLPTVGISVSNVSGVNIVDLGARLDRRLEELRGILPVGIEFEKVAWQAELVEESIDAFVISLMQAVAIVVAVLWIAMGFRTAAIVGMTGLLFVIVGTFMVMKLWGIDLQRMSLGALIIAMGMMVDNAIVVADGVLVRMARGMDRLSAAVEAATQPAFPLLGATVIAVMAFFPIYMSTEGAGEYCASLFQVVAISLMLSWIMSVTIAPLMCMWLLPDPKTTGGDEYGGRFYDLFRGVLHFAIARRYVVLALFVGLLVAAMSAFPLIDKTFFPDSARLQIMIDYWAPEGTAIETVSRDMQGIEDHIIEQSGVESVTSFVGQGPPRFYLPVEPELPNPAYGQFVVNVESLADLNRLIPELDGWLEENVPQANPVVRRYGLGPSKTWTVEARISGPAITDADELRGYADEAVEIFSQSPLASVVRTNWRQPVKKVVADYAQEQARWSSVSRENIAQATRRAYDGYVVGQYREQDKLYPVMVRHDAAERKNLPGSIEVLQVQPSVSSQPVPLAQVTRSVDVDWEDNQIWRYARRRTITVQARTSDGVAATRLLEDIRPDVDKFAATLPAGYRVEWGGEYESSRDSQASLIPGMIPAGLLVALSLVALFNSYRPPLIIVAVVPFAMIGVNVGLLSTGQPLGFVALLGVMSLAGMMIKNAIVLIDEVNALKSVGKSDYDAVIGAAVSRLRPVALAAGTTVLGVVPLLPDVFWVSMAVAIMFGLAFGTLLTMILIPALYAIAFRLPRR
ncbi:MAG: efflux RND transporter permease subunit [Pirellulales bacterium]